MKNMKKYLVLPLAALAFACGESQQSSDQASIIEEKNEKVNEKEASSPDGAFTVNKEKSKINWKGEKPTGTHEGTVQLSNAQFSFENGNLNSGSFEVDMASIACTDIEDEEKNQNLVGHLKSPDFFNVDSFPSAKFVLTEATAGSEGQYQVKGTLTIKGTDNEINFPVSITEDHGHLHVEGELTFDRSNYNVKYGSKSFFDDLGDKFINDEVSLTLKLVAEKEGA